MKLAFGLFVAALAVSFVITTVRGVLALRDRPSGLERLAAELGIARPTPFDAAGDVGGHEVVVHVTGAGAVELTVRTRLPVYVSGDSPHGERDLLTGDPAFDAVVRTDGDAAALLAWLTPDARWALARHVAGGLRHERGAWTRSGTDLGANEIVALVRELVALSDTFPPEAAVTDLLLRRAVLDVVDGVRHRATALLLDRWATSPPTAEDRELLAATDLPADLRDRVTTATVL